MCGRFIVSYTYQELVDFMSNTFNIFDFDADVSVPSFNVAPGTQVISVISDGVGYRGGTLKWGFVPSFAKDENSGYRMINARIEGIESKPSFKDSFLTKRCLILADGYYEWKNVNNLKQPYLIRKRDNEMFFFAGLYSKFMKEDKTPLYTTTIITKEASNPLQDIHDRMPVILNEEEAKQWINPSIQDKSYLLTLLHQSEDKNFSTMRVSEYVNNVRNNSPKCIEEYVENELKLDL